MLDEEDKIKEAKLLDQKIRALSEQSVEVTPQSAAIMIIAGIVTETLLEYEEPDLIMEQSIHRVASALDIDPMGGDVEGDDLAPIHIMDMYTEMGREMARDSAENLKENLDDVHEIILGIIIDYFPLWAKEGQESTYSLRILIENVIACLTFEMTVQEICDVIIDDFIPKGWSVNTSLSCLAGLSGLYAGKVIEEGEDKDKGNLIGILLSVVSAESTRHEVQGMEKWNGLGGANDSIDDDFVVRVREIYNATDEFFEEIDMIEPLMIATVIAKALGRMVAVVLMGASDDIMQPKLAKSLIKTGLKQGLKVIS